MCTPNIEDFDPEPSIKSWMYGGVKSKRRPGCRDEKTDKIKRARLDDDQSAVTISADEDQHDDDDDGRQLVEESDHELEFKVNQDKEESVMDDDDLASDTDSDVDLLESEILAALEEVV